MDTRDVLRKPKRQHGFLMHDTHWNTYGGYWPIRKSWTGLLPTFRVSPIKPKPLTDYNSGGKVFNEADDSGRLLSMVDTAVQVQWSVSKKSTESETHEG